MRSTRALTAAVGLSALLAAGPSQAGLMDFLFGTRAAEPQAARPGQRQWKIGEFTAIRLVPAESGAAPNRHPAQVQPEVLRQQLALVRTTVKGQNQPLFGSEEIAELIEPIAQALAVAGPGDDLVLLSTSRRGDGFLVTPTGITARLFVAADGLNLVVHDARFDFVNLYRGTQIEPQFTFGSRATKGTAAISSAAGSSRRADWVVLPLALQAAATAAPAAAPAAVAPAAPVAATPAPAPAPAAPAAPARARDPGFADEVEQRLLTLKRLRERGLITEEEYQQKRREILALL